MHRRLLQRDWMPSDLFALSLRDWSAQGRGKKLTSQADAQQRLVLPKRLFDESDLLFQEWVAILFINPYRPTHDDQAVESLHRIRNRLSLKSPNNFGRNSGRAQCVRDRAERFTTVVLYRQYF